MAAHIHGAAPGSKRHDSKQSKADRSSFHNGIWLCQTCSRLIDTDELRFSANVLRHWKAKAELEAERSIGKPAPVSPPPAVTSVPLPHRAEDFKGEVVAEIMADAVYVSSTKTRLIALLPPTMTRSQADAALAVLRDKIAMSPSKARHLEVLFGRKTPGL